MKLLSTFKISTRLQYIIIFAIIVAVSLVCFSTKDLIGYKVVALLLLMTVSFIAMLFEILPVLFAAVISALIWNFFFIPPLFTFRIGDAEDLLMFLLYFVIALVNAVLTFKIREAEKKARDKEEKENTIKLYNTLLNALSHELRTPISTILGSVDTLKENNDKLTATHRSELLNEIGVASLRLNRQVENILNMSRLESGILKPKKDWYDINEIINSVMQKVTITNQQIIVFHSDDLLPLFKLDAGFMEQILYNLLHNAVQYTPEKSIIEIKASYQSDNCMITISDNGNGFPEEEIPLVFEDFYRLRHTKPGGSGLGLSIVKGFVETQNGTVNLKNNEQGGAIFTICIPAETSFINSLKNE